MKEYALKNGAVLHGSGYNYTIERVLGNGTFGITYLARVQMKGTLGSLDTGINVAVKEFFMRDFNGRDECSVTYSSKDGAFAYYKSKFIHEAENLSKLHHPGIIKVIELFEENRTAYYVMEYLPNGSFDGYIATRKTLPPQECIGYALQICKALEYMHANRMLHLDLKPNNVMIDKDGRLVLIDFGLSKRFDQWGNPETSTTIGHGTPGYAPIEQANYQGNKDDSFPATMDIYALGATMFKMLTGHRPPEASAILNEGFPEDDLTAKRTPNELIEVIRKCMEPVRKNRYKSIKEVIDVLSTTARLIGEDTTILADVVVKEKPNEEPKQKYEIFKVPADTESITLSFTPSFNPNDSFRIKYWYRFHIPQSQLPNHPNIIDIPTQNLDPLIRDLNNLGLKVGKYVEDKLECSSTPAKLDILLKSNSKGVIRLSLTAFESEILEGNIFDTNIFNLARSIYQISKKYIPQHNPLNEPPHKPLPNPAPRPQPESTPKPKPVSGQKPKVVQNKKWYYIGSELAIALLVILFSIRIITERGTHDNSSQTETAQNDKQPGYINGHEWVDLGLPSGLKWATCNIEASSPSDFGDYFAWGETTTKSSFKMSNSKTSGRNFSDISGDPNYDAARANWGGAWRLPTKDECQELIDKCKWSWTTNGGHNGYKVTGPNGSSIFLSAAGFHDETFGASVLFADTAGHYWCSSSSEGPSNGDPTYGAYYMFFDSSRHHMSDYSRYFGRSIRPVAD